MRRPVRVTVAVLAIVAAACTTPVAPDRARVPTAAARPATPTPVPTSPTPTATVPAAASSGDADATVVTGRFPDVIGAEVSGVVAAGTPEAVWLVDDEPDTSDVHLVALDGTLLGTVRLTGVELRNPEDLAAGPCPPGTGGVRCIWVADIGDNLAALPDVRLSAFVEPTADELDGASPLSIDPIVMTLTYDTGPVDAEAFVVTDDGTVVVIDKRGRTPGVHVATPGTTTLTRVATLELPRPSRPMLSLFTDVVVTAADVHPDGDLLVLRTYDQLLGLELDTSSVATAATWEAATFTHYTAPFEAQGEAATWLADGRRLVTVSEGSTAITVTDTTAP